MAAWSELPPELLKKIGKCLDTSLDILRFNGVCKSWRVALSPFKSKSICTHPHVVLPSTFKFEGSASNPGHQYAHQSPPCLVQSTIWSVQPSLEDQSYRCWLINVSQEKPNKKWLSNPTCDSDFSHYPVKCSSLNLLNLRIYEHGRFYVLEQELDTGLGVSIFARAKTVVLSDSVWSETVGYKIMTLAAPNLLLWESGNEKWTEVKGGKGYEFDDIAVCEGNFFVVDAVGMVFRVDLSSKKLVEYSPAIGGNSVKLLVVFNGDLYVVERCLVRPRERCGTDEAFRGVPKDFKVYRLGKAVGLPYVELKDLGDRGLFLAEYRSFFVSAKECTGCMKNCIYFLVRCQEGYVVFAFDFKAQKKRDIPYPPDASQLVWQLPPWIKP